MRRFLFTLLLSFISLAGLVEAIDVGESATFRANSDGASSYEWTFPGNITKNGTTVQHTFDTGGQFAVTLKVRSADGQTNQITKNVTVRNSDRPTAIITASVDGKTGRSQDVKITTKDRIKIEPNFEGQNRSNLNYFWTINGQRNNQNSLDNSDFDEVGFYQVNLTVFDTNQTHLRDQSQIRVIVENQGPEVSSMSVNASKNGQVVKVTTQAKDEDGDIENYRFEVLENGRTVLSQLVTSPSASFNLSQFPGSHTYDFRVTVSDDRQRTTRFDHGESLTLNNEVENAAPELNLILAPGNEGTVEQWFNFLADASDADNDALRYQWIFPDGQQYFSSQVRYRFLEGGEQTVIVRVSDGIETIEDSIVVRVTEPPNAAPNVKIMSVLPSSNGDTQTLFKINALGTDADRDNLTYAWDMGDGGKAISSTPFYRYPQAGTYTLTVTVSDGKIETTDDIILQVSEAPARDPGLNNPPEVTIEALSGTGAVNQSFRFVSDARDPDADPLTYTWEMGDGVRYFTPQVSHFYRQAGTYEVHLVVSDGLAEAIAKINITVGEDGAIVPTENNNNAAPEVRILSVSPQLSGDTDTVFRFYTQGQDADADQLTYLWDMGDGQQMFIQNPAYKFTEPGEYQVQVQVSDGIAQATDQILINVGDPNLRSSAGENQPPVVSITAVAPSTNGDTYTLFRFFTQVNDPEANALEFEWDMGDGGVMSGQNPVYRYELPGTYFVKVVANDGELESQAEVTVTVTEEDLVLNNPENNQAPTIDLEAFPLIGDVGTTFRLSANAEDPDGDNILYRWDMGDGIRYFTSNVQHQYKEVGDYEVKLQTSDGLGSRLASQVIKVNAGGLAPTIFTETMATSLGIIDQAEFGEQSCDHFATRVNQDHGQTDIDFAAAQIALRQKANALRGEINNEALTEIKRQPLRTQLTTVQAQLQFLGKWQGRTQAGNLTLQTLKPKLRPADWQALLTFGLKPDLSLRVAQITILKELKNIVDGYRTTKDIAAKTNLKGKISKTLKLRDLISPEYNLSEDKPTLTSKKQRLTDLKAKWTEELDFTVDSELEAKLANDIAATERLLVMITQIENQTRAYFLAATKSEALRCDQSGTIDLSQLGTHQLINSLADIEGTVDTTFFLYAKASENYSQNALLFEWDLGDGRNSGGQNIYFKYPRPGLYEIELKISDELTSSRDRLRIRVYETWPKAD